jgi:hypothetical protein
LHFKFALGDLSYLRVNRFIREEVDIVFFTQNPDTRRTAQTPHIPATIFSHLDEATFFSSSAPSPDREFHHRARFDRQAES